MVITRNLNRVERTGYPKKFSGRQVSEYVTIKNGGVGERLKPAVLKTVEPERVPGVRIPPPPPCKFHTPFLALFFCAVARALACGLW